ncbi:hypothetical protein JCM19239_7446 [Vibrio variabilis]|uniref:Uncharacterized protein n=1 Tax=Vibrio variabilis TaxID=990271 RepID=A0ABQ0JDT1_9VIBR|nr:hypothetical protein JCM19239_7446 [Vibrio variabilis]
MTVKTRFAPSLRAIFTSVVRVLHCILGYLLKTKAVSSFYVLKIQILSVILRKQ